MKNCLDLDRLWQNLEDLGKLAETPDGICRLAYSPAFWESNSFVERLMREAGLSVSANKVGNVIGTLPGESDHKIVIGSHIDSVVNGGKYDGCLGVLAGIEVARALKKEGYHSRHSIEVCAWAEEEGLTIAGLVGSRAYCGLEPTETMLSKMQQFGFDEDDFCRAKADGPIDFSLELHIEQGGVLEAEHINIGVVSAIIAQKRFWVEFRGTANHAGTTPMSLREDALVKAARFIQRVDEIVRETDSCMVGTVGKVEVFPNAVNTIPGRVGLTLELRSLNENSIDRAYSRLLTESAQDIDSIRLTMEQPSYKMDPAVRAAIHQAAEMSGYSARDMGSGAGHDSMSLAQVTRAGMIFVPSVGGISHSREERTERADIERGAQVLYDTVKLLDQKDNESDGRNEQ